MEIGTTLKRDKRMLKRSTKRLLFAILMVIVPVVQFLIFYVYVNFNSFILAFQDYQVNYESLGYTVSFAGIKHFKAAWEIIASPHGLSMIGSSLILYGCNLVIVMGLALVFSYYIAKQFPMSGFFRVILYLPHIVSGVVLAILYRYLTEDVYMSMIFSATGVKPNGGLLTSADTQYYTVLFYNVWIGFGTNVMLFTNAMSGINSSVLESAKLDGVNIVQEFFYIYIPMIFPTFTTFVVMGIAGIFNNQMNMFSFFGNKTTHFDVFGFYLYREAGRAGLANTNITYSTLAALGLIITLVVAPTSLGVRKLFEKFGPSVD